MKKLISLVLTGAMAVGMLAGSAMTAAADDLPILGAGIYSSTDNFNSYIAKAIKNASEGVFDCNVDDGQQDQSTQLNQIDTAIAKGAVAIAVSMVDVTAAPAIIEKVKENGGLPVIFFNKEIEDKDVVNSYDNLYQVTSTGGDYGASIQGQMVIEYWKAHPEADKNGDGKIQLIDIMGDPGHTAAPRGRHRHVGYREGEGKDGRMDLQVRRRDRVHRHCERRHGARRSAVHSGSRLQ